MLRRSEGLFNNQLIVLVLFTGLAFILFSSSTGRIFLSDDYCTLHNIVSNKSIFLPSFFRPLGDLTLMWSYELSGSDPFYFYITNILLHVINSFLLYRFCMLWWRQHDRRTLVAVSAGLIFLTFPSHSEAIMWVIGRGVSLAVTFSLMAMIAYVSKVNEALRIILVCSCYFLALGCYESVLLLPLILLLISLQQPARQQLKWAGFMLATLVIHLAVRYFYTGGFWQAYDAAIFSRSIPHYLSAFAKNVLRLFIPPVNNPWWFSIAAIVAVALIGLVIYHNRKKFTDDRILRRALVVVLMGLMATILLSATFGVSTRTSDGDRLLYFPSVFYAMFVAMLLANFVESKKNVLLLTIVFLAFQVCFLLDNQRNWNRASKYASMVLEGIADHPQRPLYIINLPSDYKGAYVFRNCLPEALLHNNIDTAGIRVVNIVRSNELLSIGQMSSPVKENGNILIGPSTSITVNNDVASAINGEAIEKYAIILIWNNERLNKWEPR